MIKDVESLLSFEVGEHSKIREFRSKLTSAERELFDNIFLLGYREGLLLNLKDSVDCLNGEVVSPDPICNGCLFWDTPDYLEHCRLGSEPEGSKCLFRKEKNAG